MGTIVINTNLTVDGVVEDPTGEPWRPYAGMPYQVLASRSGATGPPP